MVTLLKATQRVYDVLVSVLYAKARDAADSTVS